MFRSIIGCVLRCPKDKLFDKSMQNGLTKRSVQAIGSEIEEKVFLAIELSLLRFTDSDYPFGIFKLFFY
jgi:hypothetical protein